MSAHLRLRSVSQSFGSGAVVTDVDLAVEAGQCAAVLGTSGSGKSTLLRIVAGLQTPSAGAVLIDGADVTALPPEQRPVSLMLQRPLLFPHLSVLDNVAFPARAAGKSRREARTHALPYLDSVQLGHLARRRVWEISGGQAQRVALARALAARPQVLLLDEPFSALDTELRTEMHTLLRRVRDEFGPTIIMVTHDQQEAAFLADKVAALIDGGIAQYDAPARLYTQPATLAVHRLLGGVNEVPGQVRGGVFHCALGAFALPTPAAEGAGTLVFRHESVALAAADHEAFPATVADVGRRGAHLQVEVLATGQRIFAYAPPHSRLSVGETVRMGIPIEARAVVHR